MSRFLPADFDPGKPMVLVAGSGRYPELILERTQQKGIPLRLLAFEGETANVLWDQFAEHHRVRVKVGQVGKAVKALQKLDAAYVLLAGKITPGRLFKGLQPDLKALSILAKLKERNADTIFGAVVAEFEKTGAKVLDARCFMDEDLAVEGSMTGGRRDISENALEHGIRIASEVARLDIGQGVVVNEGTVLAVEGFEGTSAMLQRAGTFGAKQALFVKIAKPAHDTRFDVPVFGLETLEVMREAGLRAAALEVGRTLILDRPAVEQQARKWGIELFGYPSPQ